MNHAIQCYPYSWIGDLLWKERPPKGDVEQEPVQICNARIQIITEITLDNGVSTERRLVLRVEQDGEVWEGTCTPEEFSRDLRVALWNISVMSVNIAPRQRRHVTEAISLMSDPERRHVYAHTGWRRIGGKLAFLLPQGAFRRSGVEIDLGGTSSSWSYELPEQPSSVEVVEGVEGTLDLLNITAPTVAWPMLSHIMSAPLRASMPTKQRAMLHIQGLTGSWKTTLATLFLCTWGDFVAGIPTESWTSTPAYLSKSGFTLKDLPLIIDDYKPSMVKNSDVTRLIQNYADGTARGRLNADTTFKKAYPIRGALLSTGEESLGVEPSVASRVLTCHLTRDMTDAALMSKAQDNADKLRAGTSDYLEWIMQHSDLVRSLCLAKFTKLRELFVKQVRDSGGHMRVATSAATSAMGGVIWLEYLERRGFITRERRAQLLSQLIQAYQTLIGDQLPEIKDQEPDEIFILHLRALISAGRVRIEDKDNPLVGDMAKGMPPVVAYRDEQGDYYHNTTAYSLVQEFLGKEGRKLLVSAPAVNKCLREKGILIPSKGGKNTKAIRIGGRKGKIIKVVHLPPYYLDETGDLEGDEE